MGVPLVSVCLPNLNTRPYLPERFESIFSQSFKDWELVVSDNYSTDGAWAFIQKMASADSRISATQAPRNGMYANWNRCIERARGRYVYIATSDDTMAPDCLERLVAGLERHPDCDLGHCKLLTIDERGKPCAEPKWPDCTGFAWGTSDLVDVLHIRRAPYDGLLHLTGRSVYLSLTQLLIRKSLFDRIGVFDTRWGSIGDFNWDMKAGLVASTLHVPDTWATFRVHSTQATAAVDFNSVSFSSKMNQMIVDAVEVCRPYLDPAILTGLDEQWLHMASEMREYYRELRVRANVLRRRIFQARNLLGNSIVRAEMTGVFVGREKWESRAYREIENWLESLHMRPIETCGA